MKIIRFFPGMLVASLVILLCGCISSAAAAYAYDPADLISDSVFTNTETMDATAIQTFLVNENSGLKNINDVEDCGSTSGTHYSYYHSYYNCGASVKASRIIYDASRAYGINPQVVLATLQKEQSLVTTPNPTASQVNCAMGYNSCGGYVGFFTQVDNGTWQLRYDLEGTEHHSSWNGWSNMDSWYASACGHNTSLYSAGLYAGNTVTFANPWYSGDPFPTSRPRTVTIVSNATAVLYCYTPYVGPYSDTGYSGSYNFVQSFEGWFGSTVYPWSADVTATTYSDAARTHQLSLSGSLPSATKIYVTVSAVNTGNQAWSNSFVNIGTSNPNDHHSPFQDSSWLSWARPARLVEASVAPGQTGTFQFSLTTPNTDGTYHESFGIVAESRAWLQSATFGFDITVSNPYNALVTQVGTYANSTHTQPVDSSEMAYGQKVYVQAKVKNIGTQTWDSSFTNVGTSSPHDRTSQFQDPSWLSAARPAHLVESSVAPGATGTIEFPILAPATNLNTTEVFGLVADGKANGWMPAVALSLHIQTVPAPMNRLLPNVKLYTGTELRSANNIYNLAMQKDGNLVIYGKGKPIWASNTGGRGINFVVMQADGNLVMYATNGKPIWATHTGNRGSSYLTIQNDGNLVIYHGGQATWASHTGHNIANTASVLHPGESLPVGGMLLSGNSKYVLVVHARTIALSSPNRTLWSVNFGSDLRKLVMQYDGNLVAYSSSSHPLWATGTTGVGSYLAMQDDGNLVIYHNGQATWASHTGGLV